MRMPAQMFRNLALMLGLGVLSGCGLVSQTDARYDPAPLTEYSAQVGITTRWSASIGSGGGYGFAPQVVNDAVYAATPSGTVSRIALATGAVNRSEEHTSELQSLMRTSYADFC